MVLPFGELIESFTLPLHITKIPRGNCPSTNRTAPCGYAVANLMFSNVCSEVGGRSQKRRSARILQVKQLSTISIPYGESMYKPPIPFQSPLDEMLWLCCAAHANVTLLTN